MIKYILYHKETKVLYFSEIIDINLFFDYLIIDEMFSLKWHRE